MKRALLIAGGTVGGLGAVLSITPPQLGSQGMTSLASNTGAPVTQAAVPQASASASATPASTSSVVTTTPARPKATTKTNTQSTPKATATKKSIVAKKATTTSTVTNTQAQSSTPAPTNSQTQSAAPAPVVKKVSGTFVGSTVNVNYGFVQVEITVVDGKITDARALQAPTGRSDRYTQYAIPNLRSQTLAAQSSNIQGVSGASYTSYGWYTSLQAALAKAGL